MKPSVGWVRRRARWLERKVAGPLLSPWRRGSVVVFHVGRSGSTVLGDLAQQHPWILWDGEIYEEWFVERERAGRSLDAHIDRWDPIEVLRGRMGASGPRFYGFEVKFFHLALAAVELEDYVDALCRAGVSHFVRLERRNLLRKVVSSAVAARAGRFHLPAGRAAELEPVRIATDAVEIDRVQSPLLDHLRSYAASNKRLEHTLADRDSLHLIYEDDILTDPQIAYAKLCHHLGLQARPGRVRFGRTNPFPLRDMIENSDEVEAALAGSEFDWMLDD